MGRNLDEERPGVELGRRGEDLVRHADDGAHAQQHDKADRETQPHDFPV